MSALGFLIDLSVILWVALPLIVAGLILGAL